MKGAHSSNHRGREEPGPGLTWVAPDRRWVSAAQRPSSAAGTTGPRDRYRALKASARLVQVRGAVRVARSSLRNRDRAHGDRLVQIRRVVVGQEPGAQGGAQVGLRAGAGVAVVAALAEAW